MIPGGANLLTTVSFQPPSPLPHVPGIASLEPFRGSFLDIGARRVWVTGVPSSARYPIPRHQVVDGDAALVQRRVRDGGWAVVSAGVAHDLGLHVGARFMLPSPHPLALRLAATTTNMGWPPGAIVLNSDDYARAWGSPNVSALAATLEPGTSAAEGQRALAAALAAGPGLVVKTAAERERALRSGSRQGLERLSQIAVLVLAAAMIAIAVAMAGLIWQRRRFFAAVKVEGYSNGALWRALLTESTLLIGVGCVIGASFGLLGQGLLSRSLTHVTGFPVAYSLAALPALVSCLAVVVLSVAIVAVFGVYAVRSESPAGAPE
jgi:putative ABC transport system permease protein